MANFRISLYTRRATPQVFARRFSPHWYQWTLGIATQITVCFGLKTDASSVAHLSPSLDTQPSEITQNQKYHFYSNYRCFATAEGLVTLRDFVNMLLPQATGRDLLFPPLTWPRDMQTTPSCLWGILSNWSSSCLIIAAPRTLHEIPMHQLFLWQN